MKYLFLTTLILTALTASAQTKPDTTLTVTIKLPASVIQSMLLTQSVNVDTMQSITAAKATLHKQQSAQAGQYIMQTLGEALKAYFNPITEPKK